MTELELYKALFEGKHLKSGNSELWLAHTNEHLVLLEPHCNDMYPYYSIPKLEEPWTIR